MKLHRCLGLAVLLALFCAPLAARAEDAGPDASAPTDSGADASANADTGAPTGNPPDTTSSSSGSPPITVDPGGDKVPGSGQTEAVPDDGGCSVSPASVASPSALSLALAALWFVRRKKR